MTMTERVNQYAAPIKWVSVILIALALFLIMSRLPIQPAIRALEGRVDALGFWGPLVYALFYAAATLAMVPGAALTLGAGAIFGLWLGTATVSLGSTTGAALALLIARYLARRKVEKQLIAYPSFGAVDKAIGEGGWKIVAFLRLSPAIPFNLQNYLYGITSIRFWPCVLTSWIAMLPGTFMYVYFGHLARAGAEAAARAEGSRDPGRWIMTAVGLAATVAVTVYVTRLARRAIRHHTRIESGNAPAAAQTGAAVAAAQAPLRWPWGATAAALLAVASLTAAACVQFVSFGPPAADLKEAYETKPGGPTFDHTEFDALLKEHVDPHGWVDYDKLAAHPDPLDRHIAALREAPFDKMGRDEKLALLINAYNAFTLRLILDYRDGGRLESIRDIPKARRWDDRRWNVGGYVWSLNDIEHHQIRPKFKEPRIHFTLVCAAYSCPKLRNEAFTAERLEEQLEDQTVYCHQNDRWLQFDAGRNAVSLTALYDWYGDDFVQEAGSVLSFVSRYSPGVKRAIDGGRPPARHTLEYDWKLNSRKNAP